METEIKGGEYWLMIDPAGGTDYTNLVCLTDHDINLTNSTQTKQTYCGPLSVPGDQSQNISFNAVIIRNPDSGRMSAPDIYTLAQNKTTFSWKSAAIAPINGDVTKTGKGYFSSYREGYSAADLASFSATLQVDGLVTQTIETGLSE